MKNVIIVGAGPAGLTAAYELLKKSNKYNVIILEKKNTVGGMSSSVLMKDSIIDTGIHRFFSKNDQVNQIWQELLPIQGKPSFDDKLLNRKLPYKMNGPNPEMEDKVMLIKNRITRIYYNSKFYDYPVKINLTTIKNIGFFSTFFICLSYLKAILFRKKENSLEDLYINKFGKKLYRMFFESYTEKVWGKHPKNISSSWGNQRVKGISISELIKDFFFSLFKIKTNKNTETSLIEQFTYPKYGSGQMWDEMANCIRMMGGTFYFNVDVSSINFKNNKVNSITFKINDKTKQLKTDIFISSIPISNLFQIMKGIEIPKSIYRSATTLPYRDFISIGFKVDKLFLKNTTDIPTLTDLAPDNWIYIQDKSVKMGRIQIFNNWSPYLFSNKVDIKKYVILTLEYFTDKKEFLWDMSDKEIVDFAIKEAEKINLFNKNNIIDTKVIKIEKAYPGYFDSYKDMPKIINYLNKIPNLYCIGRNGQHRYNNMDHSMLTAIETVNHIIYNKNNKDSIWSVNTEDDYHEIIKKKRI